MACGICCFDQVSTSEVGIVESFGKFSRLSEAGCVPLLCPCEYVVGKVTLRVQELDIQFETKTKDNVFVTIHLSIQYQAIREKVYLAYYSLTNVQQQMQSYVYDIVRAALTSMTLDQSFEAKEEVSHAVKQHLQEIMAQYGYSILNVLVTDLSPDERVRRAMNAINENKRLKEAAYQRAEGEKIVKVKQAEAEAESMYLSGVGVSKQRHAIMGGLRESIVDFSTSVQGTTPKDVMDLLVLTQYFDTLNEVGKHSKLVFTSGENTFRNSIMEGYVGLPTDKVVGAVASSGNAR